MNPLSRRLVGAATASLLTTPVLAFAPAQAADPVVINLVGINDFHGRIDSATVQWAGTVKQLEADAPTGSSLLVSAGDNVSASVFASSVQDDNPTIDVLNSLGLDASATGNHEFDKGYDDLVNRIAERADFPILGANVTKKADGSNALDPSATFDIAGLKVAVIGAVTQETPTLVSPDGVAGLSFGDPVAGINAEAQRLQALPEADRPDVLVASYHEGAPDGTLSLAQAMAGSQVFRHLVEDTSGDVDAIFMGHTHQKYAYEAPVPGAAGKTRPIIQTGNYGENVGQIKLSVDPETGDVTSFMLRNVARSTATETALVTQYPALGDVKKIRDDAVTYANKVGNVQKGEITADITRAFNGTTEDRGSESTAGGLVADALLETVAGEPAGADLGIVNPGGLRSPDLTFAGVAGDPVNTDGVVTYGELNAVLPFANNLNSVKLTGASLKKVLEQQWQRDDAGNVPSRAYLQLGLSKNVHYTFDSTKPEGSRITSVRINGEPLDLARTYKVATFSFLAAGGDNFRAFKEGANTDTGLVDRDGWITYFEKNSPISPDFAKRSVEVRGIKSQYRVGGSGSFTLPRLNLTSTGSPANTRVFSKLFYGDGKVLTLPSQPVTAGAATVTFTLPAGQSGAMRIESTATPTNTKVVVPIDVTGATVAADAAPGTYGKDLDVDVTVSGPDETPTGDVSLKKGDTVVGSATLAGGEATVTVDTTDLGAGSTELTVAYAGDSNYVAANGKVTVEVAKAGTTTAAQDPEPTKISDDAPIDVTVESATGTEPTGDVTISDGDDEIGTAEIAEGAATVETDLSGLTTGQHTLTVDYAGDADHEASTTTVDVDVLKGTTDLAATSDGAAYGTSATIEIEGDEVASGLVYIGHGDDVVGVGFLTNGVGRVKLDKTALEPGDYDLDVYYGGSGSYDPAQTQVSVTITKAASALKKASVSPSKVVRKKTKPHVTLSVKASGFVVDGGKVTLRSGGKSYSGTVRKGSVKIRLGVFTSTGSKKVTASYAGNDYAEPSTTSFTVKVVKK
ncbi:MAG: hypothetical protein JWQ91_1068 [Aeromicrobium sp.]|uniref:Ig-like domain repeat protein n=1 Tax=Aeromicrobium sp. TaxID=1871063 RepID=UPI002626CE89|nr:5'-nucleotidase C-terminal domain-containing protein [Aeromicrobium sp.]MCW2824151.1 hypothetical protein [Aeromicrobium sp.]